MARNAGRRERPLTFTLWAGLGLLFAIFGGLASADEPDPTARMAEALTLTSRAAATYQLAFVDGESAEFALSAEPILRWSNPAAGEIYGNVFIWTHEGRPEVIGSLYQWYSPYTHGAHEFHSLATVPIAGVREGKPVWQSGEPGVQFRVVPEVQTVEESRGARLRRMRDIARQFSIVKTDREEITQQMRLLPQPAYRYPAGTRGVLDGGLFVFVQGTDPEVILLVEARSSGERWQWQFALARMNSVQFVATYGAREVWRVETLPWGRVASHREPYTSFGNIPRPGSDR